MLREATGTESLADDVLCAQTGPGHRPPAALVEQADEEAALAGRVQSAKRLAENNVVVLRNLSLLLRPSMLDDLGLIPALKWQAREVSPQRNPRVNPSTP